MTTFSFIGYVPPQIFRKKLTIQDNYVNKQIQHFIHQTLCSLKFGFKKNKIACVMFNKFAVNHGN